MQINSSKNIEKGIIDYKFFCFNGSPQFVQVDLGRFEGHVQNFYDMNWQKLKLHCSYPEGEGTNRPVHFEQMKEIAATLSAEFPFVRVDLYDVGDTVCFGELTFYPSSGYGTFRPDSFDFKLGDYFTEYQ